MTRQQLEVGAAIATTYGLAFSLSTWGVPLFWRLFIEGAWLIYYALKRPLNRSVA